MLVRALPLRYWQPGNATFTRASKVAPLGVTSAEWACVLIAWLP